MRGNYHVKLQTNLKVTEDYDLAADRTKRQFMQQGDPAGQQVDDKQAVLSRKKKSNVSPKK